MTRAGSAQDYRRHNSVTLCIWLAAVAIVAMCMVFATGQASTQTARPRIFVASTLSAAAATQTPLLIRVEPPDSVPRGSFVRVRGLPPMAALSEGHSIAPGAWAIPLTALSSLKIMLPTTTSGPSELSITLVALDGSVLAEARSTLQIADARPAADERALGKTAPAANATILRAGAPQQPAPVQADRTMPSPQLRPALSQEERERALRLVKRGDAQLAEGGIAQARLLYERAAEVGLAQGAMALAATYDAAELERLGVLGLKPDRDAARRWYERALQLGAGDAEQRLRRMGAN